MKIETVQWLPARGRNGSTRTAGEILRAGACAGSVTAARVSCVGRTLVPGQRLEEEVEAALKHVPADTARDRLLFRQGNRSDRTGARMRFAPADDVAHGPRRGRAR